MSLYSGSFKDLRVLSFMYESFKGQTRVYRTNTMDSQAPASGAAPLPLRSTLVALVSCWHLRRYFDSRRGGRTTPTLKATEATS